MYISGTSEKPEYVNKSINLVFLQDFLITPEQCRLPPARHTDMLDTHALIIEDYAMTQAYKINGDINFIKNVKISITLHLESLAPPRAVIIATI